MGEKLTVGLLQRKCSTDPAANLSGTIEAVREAAKARRADRLPPGAVSVRNISAAKKMPICFDLAEPIPGPTTEALGKLARELGVVIVASLFERRAAGLYHNTAAVLDADGALLGLYRKMHIPDDPLYYEKFYFTPGDLGFRTFDTRFGRIGVLVCWDQWYPEGARLSACAARTFFSIPPPSAGIRPKKRNTARRSSTPGAPSSAPTPSPTAFTWPR